MKTSFEYVCVCSRTGPMLGIRECLLALCVEGKTESRVHVTAVTNKLMNLLSTTKPADTVFQVGIIYRNSFPSGYNLQKNSVPNKNEKRL